MKDEKMSPFPWPEIPMQAFAPDDGALNAHLAWVKAREEDMQGYVEGYQKVAVAAFNAVTDQGISPEHALFPLAFLWRHHVELALKDIIAAGRVLNDEPWGYPAGHDLGALWRQARPYIVACGPENPADAPEVGHVEAVILEFVTIDPLADGFRYPLNRKGAATLVNAPAHVSIGRLHKTMEAIGNFFCGVRSEQMRRIDYIRQYERDRWAEYQAEYDAEMRAEYEAEMRRAYGDEERW